MDRVSPDDRGQLLSLAQPWATTRRLTGDDKRRVKFMAIKGLEQAIDNLSRVRKKRHSGGFCNDH